MRAPAKCLKCKCKMQGMARAAEIKAEGDREGSLCFGRDGTGEARRREMGDREGGLATDSD